MWHLSLPLPSPQSRRTITRGLNLNYLMKGIPSAGFWYLSRYDPAWMIPAPLLRLTVKRIVYAESASFSSGFGSSDVDCKNIQLSSWWQFHQHFINNFRKKIQSQIVRWEKLRKTLLHEIVAHKMLVKLTPG